MKENIAEEKKEQHLGGKVSVKKSGFGKKMSGFGSKAGSIGKGSKPFGPAK